MTEYEKGLAYLSASARSLQAVHTKWRSWDGVLYNGGTVVVLLCTISATFIPVAQNGWQYWLPKALLGFVTFWVALDRAKSYGQRWRFHIERENQYGVLLDLIGVFPSWPDDTKTAKFAEIVAMAQNLRSGESAVPGSGVTESLEHSQKP